MPHALAVIFFLVGLVPTVAKKGTAAASADSGEVQRLKQELHAAQQEVADLRAKGASQCPRDAQAFSPLGAVARAWDLSGAAVRHVFDKTDKDEQIAEVASRSVAQARSLSSAAARKVFDVNYTDVVDGFKTSDVYLTKIAPHVDKVASAVEPYMSQYVSPAMERARTIYKTTAKAVEADVLPVLQRKKAQVAEVLSNAPTFMDGLIAPIYDGLARLAPEHATALPSGLADRVVFLLAVAFLGYHLLFLALRLLRVAFALMRLCFRICWFIVGVLVLIPLRIIFRVLCCPCICCFCRGKRGPKAVVAASTTSAEAKGQAGKAGPKAAEAAATVEEIAKLLENARKEKKLESAAKQLAGLVKSGKAVPGPKAMAGKKVTKEVFTKAVGKFKELKIKSLNV